MPNTKVKNEITIESIIKKQRSHFLMSNTKLIKKSYEFAKKYHGDQLRESGEPYITHPLNVANILTDFGMDDNTICAALLHDVVEDTEATNDDLVREFGDEIASMVAGVTKLSRIQYTTDIEAQVDNYRKMFLAMGKDIRVILIKLADRLHNMRTLEYIPHDRQIANAKETMDLYAPLANRLGIFSMKWELEDLAFKFLNPKEYNEILEGVNKKRTERLDFLDVIKSDLEKELSHQKIKADITGREKHIYSIYRKMQRDHKTLDQIYDLFALRIIVNDVKDCYQALGVVHEMYTPMPGRFKDYIAVPKKNMYQSIHTTVLGNKGTPFEVQIRTWEMHRTAEFGIAAHWAYKEENYKGEKKNVTVTDDKLAWLRETLEWQKNTENPDEFLNSLKTELYEDEVYVFTPKGLIKVLPRDATPIDFAYSVHEQVGHKMVGCKINSKIMPITTKLQSGDIVEIITSDNSMGPSRDWLKFVKTSNAKNRINQWFKKVDRNDNIEKGKEIIEREVKKLPVKAQDLFSNPDWVKYALDRYNFQSLDDMYAAVGFGSISANKILARLLEKYDEAHADENFTKKIEELSQNNKPTYKPSKNGVVVKGIDNCLVKLSKCCNPLPGDEIIGYITKGRGVSVHRVDCPNINELLNDKDRIIDVYWYEDVKGMYTVELEAYSTDRSGLLRDILKQIDNSDVELLGVNTRTTKEKIAIINLNLQTKSLDELRKLSNQIRNVESVYDVKRKRG